MTDKALKTTIALAMSQTSASLHAQQLSQVIFSVQLSSPSAGAQRSFVAPRFTVARSRQGGGGGLSANAAWFGTTCTLLWSGCQGCHFIVRCWLARSHLWLCETFEMWLSGCREDGAWWKRVRPRSSVNPSLWCTWLVCVCILEVTIQTLPKLCGVEFTSHLNPNIRHSSPVLFF